MWRSYKLVTQVLSNRLASSAAVCGEKARGALRKVGHVLRTEVSVTSEQGFSWACKHPLLVFLARAPIPS